MAAPQSILLTGASGFIAKHILLRLLNAGHSVTGSVRSRDREDEVRAAVGTHLTDPTAQDRLRFVTLDLTQDAGWEAAFAGVEALIHTASPFPITQPKDEQDLIRPAVDGTLRALKAAQAAGVARVVLTSSVAAIAYRAPSAAKPVMDEDDWSDLDHPTATAYVKSKTLAERAAWDFAAKAPGLALTTINPVLVTGPPLDRHFGSSISVIERVLASKDPMLPNFGFGIVDVRDVAEMHLRALERPETSGRRYIAADRFLWFKDIAEIIAALYPYRRITRRVAPDFVVRALSLFDPSIRTILPGLGRRDELSNARARGEMGMNFLNAADSIRDTARFLVENELVT
ncbi:MAG: NAD-dependent epimerase/dehydratase family protein [Rhodobacteraceae bacterium]|nr:NAD-dependent epimerase/dehydratase family protein [Paracoccaceae bacterium]